MKVESISGINYSNGITYGSRVEKQNHASKGGSTAVADLAKVPVVVLLAMNPATLNANIPTQEMENMNNIAVVSTPKESPSAPTYVLSPETQEVQQSNAPYGWPYFTKHNILYNNAAKGNEDDYTIVYTAIDTYDKKDVWRVFLVKNGENTPIKPDIQPTQITRLIYHNIGADKEFVGAEVYQPIFNKSGEFKGSMIREIRLDDETANHLMLMLANKTNLNNKTDIILKETDSPNLLPLKVY